MLFRLREARWGGASFHIFPKGTVRAQDSAFKGQCQMKFEKWSIGVPCGTFLLFLFSNVLAAQTPVPAVKGPIPVTSTSHPFGAATQGLLQPIHLERYGYLEEEYFVSGNANVYDWDASGNVVVKANEPYTTRMIVRRPKDPKRFSGNVILEPINQSWHWDLFEVWNETHLHMMEHGDAYVAFTAKPVTVATLKKFDPVRYASLSWPNPLPRDQWCDHDSGLPADSYPDTENGLLWDIISQIGALVRSDSPSNPLKEYAVKYVYGTGFSQTGSNMIAYINIGHDRALLPNGKQVFDGFLLGGASTMTPINQCSTVRIPAGDTRNFIHANVPVIRFNTQSDYAPAARQPDSELFRLYELPGVPHGGDYHYQFAPAKEDMVKAGFPDRIQIHCVDEFMNDVPLRYPFDGFFSVLDRWVREGLAPPKVSRIVPSSDGPAPPAPAEGLTGVPGMYDRWGNLEGGLRSPYVDVPIAIYTGKATGPGCGYFGFRVPFTPDRLKDLYPTHADYVSKVNADVDRLSEEGWLTKTDAAKIKADAAKADIPPADPAKYEERLTKLWEGGWLSELDDPHE